MVSRKFSYDLELKARVIDMIGPKGGQRSMTRWKCGPWREVREVARKYESAGRSGTSGNGCDGIYVRGEANRRGDKSGGEPLSRSPRGHVAR